MKFLQLTSEWIIVIPLVTGLLLFKSLKKGSLIIFFIVCAAFIPQLATTFLKDIDPSTLSILYNIYTPVEVILFLSFFGTKLKWTNLFSVLAIVFALLTSYFFYTQGIKSKVISELICLSSLLYVFLIFFYFLKMFKDDAYLFSMTDPFNWYILGSLLYFPCTFFLFADYLNTSSNLSHGKSTLWVVHNFFNITLYLTFTIGFIKEKKLM